MTAQPNVYVTEAEYLDGERISGVKHEYYAGRVYAMAGASEGHNLIAINLAAMLRLQLRGRACRAYPSDMRVKVMATGLHTYPDFTIVCGPSQFTPPEKRDTLTNPTVIIEILSRSTESFDRGEKFQHYRTIPTLQEYLLIAQNKPYVERFVRHDNHEWILSDYVGMEAIVPMSALQLFLPLVEIYEDVPLVIETAALREIEARERDAVAEQAKKDNNEA